MKTIGTHNYYIYILTNKTKTVLYTGITNDLNQRLKFHKENTINNPKAFTSKYKCFNLIYYEHFNDVNQAINREKQIKGWKRVKKINLIESFNPNWEFLNSKI